MGRSRHGYSQSKTRDVVSIVFGFFLSVFVALFALLVVLRFFVVSSRGVLNAVDDSFYNQVLEYVEQQANYYTLPTGIDPSVLNGVFEVEEVRRDVDASIEAAFAGQEYAPNTTAARERLGQRLNAAFAADGVVAAGGATQADLDKISKSYTDEIMEIYNTAVKMPGLDAVHTINGYMSKYGLIALGVCALFCCVLVILIVRLHHHVHRSIRYITYSVGGAALMLLVIPLVMYASGFYKGLSVEPQYFYTLCVSLVSSALRTCMYAAGVLFAITILLVIVGSKLRGKAITHKHTRRH